MKKLIIVTGIAAIFAAGTVAAADDRSTETRAGFGSGAVIGAIVGGPAGAIIGSAAGAVIGQRVHKAKDAKRLETELGQARSDMSHLKGALDKAAIDLARLNEIVEKQQDTQELVEGLSLDVPFRTDNSELGPQGQQQLVELARLLTAMPEVQVKLEGYADPRGTPEYNETLSAQRATSVQTSLENLGVDTGRITLVAHGETLSSSQEGDFDAYAMERRVSISLSAGSDSTAVARAD